MPGFIANRILMPYINEAIYVLQVRTGARGAPARIVRST